MNISRIVLGLILIVGAGGALAGGTSAFFSDTESSTGNSFTAGAIDLKIDNDSYYNGNRCVETAPDVWQWQGPSLFPEPNTPCTTSWHLTDLDPSHLFFNFTDLKPDDDGEDTISLHVDDNPAYVCLDMTLTSNNDISSVDPELCDGDQPEDINDSWDGELAQNLQMFWWADDGDNVYEQGETPLMNGVQTVSDMFGPDFIFSVALADALNNVWTPNSPGPIPGGQTHYIAKAWCFGTMGLTPLAQDGLGTDGPQEPGREGTGYTCDGSALNNITQTDGVTLDVGFRAVQSRHNEQFLCGGDQTDTAKLTVTKIVTNNNGGNNVIADFQLFVFNTIATPVTSGVQTVLIADTYTVTESGVSGYQATFGGDCDSNGQITLNPGDVKSCTITNDDIPAAITLIKSVTNNNGGNQQPFQFTMRIDGNVVPQNTSVAVTANTPHAITEDPKAGYSFVSITGSPKCPAVLGGTATLDEGESITCTITNDDNP